MAQPPQDIESVRCPYNSSHRIMKFRLNTHLTKCKKGHLSSNHVTCKFNANHVVPASELQHHYEICTERYKFELPSPSKQEQKVASRYPIHHVTVDEETSWDDNNVPTYNPHEYCMNNPVLTKLDVASAAMRRHFRLAERQRMTAIDLQHCEKNQTNTPASEMQPSPTNTGPNTNKNTIEKQPANEMSAPKALTNATPVRNPWDLSEQPRMSPDADEFVLVSARTKKRSKK